MGGGPISVLGEHLSFMGDKFSFMGVQILIK